MLHLLSYTPIGFNVVLDSSWDRYTRTPRMHYFNPDICMFGSSFILVLEDNRNDLLLDIFFVTLFFYNNNSQLTIIPYSMFLLVDIRIM
jgi:hypothetical protein